MTEIPADLPRRFTSRRSVRLATRRLSVEELRARGFSRAEARALVYKPAADARARQERATRVLRNLTASRLGIPRQRKEKK